MNPMLTIAQRAADEAAKVIVRGFRQLDQLTIQDKGRGDWVSAVDIQAEQVIKQILLDKYPQHDFIGEESGAHSTQHSDFQWIVDPLDGSSNFVHGFGHFAISIALLKEGQLELAIVYNPINIECFTAVKGQGARLNDKRIRVNGLRDARLALVATGFPYRNAQLLPQQHAFTSCVLEKFSDIRRLGACALDLCFVACARQDAYFEIGLNSWDMAAGILIAQEAGAIVSDLHGNQNMLENGSIICGNLHLHRQLRAQLSKAIITDTK